MAVRDQLNQLLQPLVEDLGYEFVGLEYHPHPTNGIVRLYIDHPENGIGLHDCETVSREVAGLLDVEDPISGHYNLEVSSPGLDRPLFTAEHFARFAGERAKVTLERPVSGRRKLTGKILSVDNNQIRMLVDADEIQFEHAAVAKARLVPSFGD